jgi:CheY-like chemotaxis protein
MLRQYLASAGYEVYSILDSRVALEQIAQLQPQLIILDILMPHLDGWTLLAQLRQHPAIQHIPIMMCSIVEEQRPAILIGANDYMVKPVRQNELLARVQHWTTHPATILVIDDDPDARSIIRTMLEPHHYRIVEASHGAEALAMLPQAQPHLLVLDLMMPVMDGFTFLSQLRTDSIYATLPVLILSARDLTAAERGWLHKNAQEYLQKSQLTEEQFLHCVQQILTLEVPHAHRPT